MPLGHRTIMLFLLCLARVSSAGADLPPGNYTIVTFGDSTTAPRTVNGQPLYIYTDILRNELPSAGVEGNVFNHGRGGRHTGSVSDNSRFNIEHALDHYPDVLARNPDIVIMQFGINDSWVDSGEAVVSNAQITGSTSRIPYDANDPRKPDYAHNYRDNLTLLVRTFKAANIRVILMTPNYITREQWRRDVLEIYVQRVRQVAAAEAVELINIWQKYLEYASVAGKDCDDLLLDGVHPNAAGHRLVADSIYELLAVNIPDLPALTDKRTYRDFEYVYDFEPPHNVVPDHIDKYPSPGINDFDINRLDKGGHNSPVGAAVVSNGILTIDTGATTMGGSSSGGRWYTAYDAGQVWKESSIARQTGFTVELCARVVSGEQSGNQSFTLSMGADTESKRLTLALGEAQTSLNGMTLDANINTEEFCVFRVVALADRDGIHVFRGGNDGKLAEIFSGTAGSGAGPYFNFGDTSSSFGGKVEIDYIAFTPGCYAPMATPDCREFLKGDVNRDCYVDLLDIVQLGDSWLQCTDPAKTECQQAR